jgi:hypothetical protein
MQSLIYLFDAKHMSNILMIKKGDHSVMLEEKVHITDDEHYMYMA